VHEREERKAFSPDGCHVLKYSTIDIHGSSIWSLNAAIKLAGQEIIYLWMQALQTTALAQLAR
jgi:hypothetical protein